MDNLDDLCVRMLMAWVRGRWNLLLREKGTADVAWDCLVSGTVEFADSLDAQGVKRLLKKMREAGEI